MDLPQKQRRIYINKVHVQDDLLRTHVTFYNFEISPSTSMARQMKIVLHYSLLVSSYNTNIQPQGIHTTFPNASAKCQCLRTKNTQETRHMHAPIPPRMSSNYPSKGKTSNNDPYKCSNDSNPTQHTRYPSIGFINVTYFLLTCLPSRWQKYAIESMTPSH